jgi:hypothetical protein
MTAIQIHRHLTGQVTCHDCGFHEESTADPQSPTIQSIVAHGAMHVVAQGHHVHEHIEDDREVTPAGGHDGQEQLL